MTVPFFEFSVVGHEPRPWGVGQSQWVWRTAVAAAARDRARELNRSVPLAVDDRSETLSVEIVFRLTAPRFLDADLDNLAKPLLDTLFRAMRVQAPREAGEVSGVLFDIDDSRVVRLVLEKRSFASSAEAGVGVRVAVASSVQPQGNERSDRS